MREHEKRYRSQIGKQSGGEKARAQYRRAADRRDAQKKNGQMTYDDYLAQVKDADKIIEVDDDSGWTKFTDALRQYAEWLGQKKDKYVPILIKKAKDGAQTAAEKQPISKSRLKQVLKSADSAADPLKKRFGEKNVYFTAITGTAVLVLLGGFVMLRGSGGGDSVVQNENSNQNSFSEEVAGVDTGPAQPDFEVALPEEQKSEEGIAFDPDLGVASYRDMIREKTITISQQPLAETQKADPEGELELIAVNLLAETTFETKFGTTYLSNNSPDGTSSQIAFFMTDELLIFIRTSGSSVALPDWIDYINTLSST